MEEFIWSKVAKHINEEEFEKLTLEEKSIARLKSKPFTSTRLVLELIMFPRRILFGTFSRFVKRIFLCLSHQTHLLKNVIDKNFYIGIIILHTRTTDFWCSKIIQQFLITRTLTYIVLKKIKEKLIARLNSEPFTSTRLALELITFPSQILFGAFFQSSEKDFSLSVSSDPSS